MRRHAVRQSRCRALLAGVSIPCLIGGALALGAGGASAQAVLPVGGTVASGSATITSNGTTTTVTQTSDRAIVNWSGFDVGAGKAVAFDQPGTTSAILNRVTGSASSTIAGSITANGAVYLVNPNGIAITGTGSVQTGGGFVASTLGIADADFNAGRLVFTGGGASKRVANKGAISVGSGGYVALLGGSVLDSGTITVPLGRVGLGSGESVALDLNGDGFMSVAVPTATLTQGNAALIEMTGSIAAAGGWVVLSAATARDAVRNVINMPGSISADSATGNGGTIVLLGGDGGTVVASGTLSARATGASGDGGTIETSGEHVDLNGLNVSTAAANGAAGTWLIDPTDFTVAASGGDITGAQLSASLNAGNVTIQSSQGTVNPNGNGDINVNDGISWTAGTSLSLSAARNIAIAAPITASNAAGQLTLTTGGGSANTGAVTDTAALSVGVFNLANGNWSQTGTLPAFSATDFRFDPVDASFLRVAGGDGSTGNPYRITDVYGLQGIASSTLLASNFAIANPIDASGTAGWNGGTGWLPIGTDGAGNAVAFGADAPGFAGTFDGQSNTVSGLTIARASTANVGMFGYTTGGSIGNLVLTGVAIAAPGGSSYVGALIGQTFSPTAIANVAVSGTVAAGGSFVGGLVGYQLGTVTGSSSSAMVSGASAVGGLIGAQGGDASTSFATGAVSGISQNIGGFAGTLNGVLSNSYSTGDVTFTGATTTRTRMGGLVGTSSGGGQIVASHATGAVTSTSTDPASSVGGLVGYQLNESTINQAYATGAVTSAGGNTGGLVGWDQNGSASDVYATGRVQSSGASAGGLIGTFSSGTLASAWASGAVGGAAASGGVVGTLAGGTIASSVYWDTYSTRQASAVATVASGTSAALSVTSDPNAAGGPTAYTAASYANLTAAGGLGTSTPTGFVFMQGDITRPFLAFEVPTGATVASNTGGSLLITNSHQLQLIGYDAARLGQNYALTGDINLAQTGAVVAGTPGSYAGMWAATGFVPIGRLGGQGGLVGNVDGQGHAISALTIHDTAPIYVGLFGFVAGGAISNLGVTGATVTAPNTGAIGGLVGNLASGTIANSYTTGSVAQVGSASDVGGLVGAAGGAISNSYSTATVIGSSSTGGLVGQQNAGGTLTGVYATGPVTGTSSVGGLVGSSGAAISNAHATGGVTASGSNVGGLVGNFGGATNTISNAYATGAVSGAGRVGGLIGNAGGGTITVSYAGGSVTGTANYVGGLIGYENNGQVSASYATATVSGTGYVGGLIGYLPAGTVTNAYATGAVMGTGDRVGGLVGHTDGTIGNVYASGAVHGNGSYAGGLAGVQENGSIANAYATGTVSGTSYAAGLVGYQNAGTIDQAYATGAVSGGSASGLVASVHGSLTNAYWDSYSTGTGAAATEQAGTLTNVGAVTSDPGQAAASNYAYKASAYGKLTAANWVFFDGQTRPFGAWEAVASGGTIINAHQLQLIGAATAAAQGGSYTLGGNIDLSQTGAVVAGTAGSYAGMWASTGWVSLGSDGTGRLWNGSGYAQIGYDDIGRAGAATGFGGTLNGAGHTIAGLTINRAGIQNVGLFGGSSGTISNLTVSGNVTGYISVGGLVGAMQGGSITGVTSAVNVMGNSNGASLLSSYAGGLVGFAVNTAISGSSASGTVSAGGAAGGLVGLLSASTLTASSASGAVTGRAGKSGGLVGIVEGSSVAGGSSSGSVNGVAAAPGYGVVRDGGTYNGSGG